MHLHLHIVISSIYGRESGVRSLEKHIGKIARKIAYKAVESSENDAESSPADTPPVLQQYIITPTELESYIGKPKYPEVSIFF
jgi:ATP-dependent Lon protease